MVEKGHTRAHSTVEVREGAADAKAHRMAH